MLKDAVILIVISVFAVAGVAVWVAYAPAHPASAITEPPIAETKPEPKTTLVAGKPSRKPEAVPEPVEEELAVGADLSSQAVVSAPIVHRDPPPFPAVDKIATGMREDSITETYGDPTLSTVTSKGGRRFETFVYASDHGRLATVIRLEDGKVAEASSQSEPVHAVGLSAPRRKSKE